MNETLQTIHHLRSERQFSDRPILQEEMETILEATIRTANSSARQAYSIIVLQDAEKIKAACGYKGAALLVFCVDQNRLNDIADYLNQDYAKNETQDFLAGSTDALMAAQTAVIAAKSLGIDSLITNGVHRQDFNKLYELLNLPREYCFPLIGVVLGYAANPENTHYKGRLKTGVIHYDSYHPMTKEEIEEEIAIFDAHDTSLGICSYTQWEAMGFKHYYEWLFQAWSRKQEEDAIYPVLQSTKYFK